MKTRKLFLLLAMIIASVNSQAQVSVNVNIGPPAWAPAAPPEVHYYYIPDIEVYYDVPARNYIYLSNGRWVRTAVLPARYRGYDLYRGRTVYLTDYRGNAPYVLYKEHKVKYKGHGWKHKEHPGKGHGKGRHR